MRHCVRLHLFPLTIQCQGEIVFEGLVIFTENRALAPETTHNVGRGGAIYNAETGIITFNGPLTARWNIAAVSTTVPTV